MKGIEFTGLQPASEDFPFEFFETDKQQTDWSGTDTPFWQGKSIISMARDAYHNFNRVGPSYTSVVGADYGSTGVDMMIGPGVKMFMKYAQVEFNPTVNPPGGTPTPGTRVVKVLGMVPPIPAPGVPLFRSITVEFDGDYRAISTTAVCTPVILASGLDIIIQFSVADFAKWDPNPANVYRARVASTFVYVDG